MKQLTCEMCGGTDFIKQDGVFVCQSCGIKYTVEEARKIMIEGTVDVSGSTVKVDNTHLISNYIEMARNAYGSGNQAEAESYCNKIIEIEPTNYTAWMIKGKAAGWQSTLQNPRVPESVSAFSKAIEYAPEDEKEDLIDDAKEEIKNLAKAMLTLRADRFVKWPDAEETAGFAGDLTSITNAVAQFISQVGVMIPISEIMGPAATIISQSVSRAWTGKIQPEYKGNGLDLPSQYDYSKFLDRVGHCIALLETAINLAGDDEENISRYEDLIMLNQQTIDNCGYDYKFWNYGSDNWQINNMINALKKDGVIPDPRHDRYWFKCVGLNASAIVEKQNAIKKYKEKITSIRSEKSRKEAEERAAKELKEKEEAKKRLDAYWAERPEEKTQLETERGNLNEKLSSLKSSFESKINSLRQELDEIPGKQELSSIEKSISELSNKKNSLGLFKNREKIAIQEKIDQLDSQRKEIAGKIELERSRIESQIKAVSAEFQPRIDDLQLKLHRIIGRLNLGSDYREFELYKGDKEILDDFFSKLKSPGRSNYKEDTPEVIEKVEIARQLMNDNRNDPEKLKAIAKTLKNNYAGYKSAEELITEINRVIGLSDTGLSNQTSVSLFECPVCGYVYEGYKMPDDFKCPTCKVPGRKFKVVN